MLIESFLKKLNKLPEDTNHELDQIRIDIKNVKPSDLEDGSVTESKLNTSLRDKITSIGNKLSLKTNNKNDLVSAVNEVVDNLTTTRSSLSGLETKVNTVETETATHRTQILSLTDRATTVEGKATKNATDILGLTTTVNGFNNYTITISNANPTGGKHGDIHFKY